MMYIKEGERKSKNELDRLYMLKPKDFGYEILYTVKPYYDPFTHKLVDNGNVKRDDKWFIDWQPVELEGEELEIQINKLKKQVKKEISLIFQNLFYSNVKYTFNDKEYEIQFRDEVDRNNLANLTQMAQLAIDSDTKMNYRMADNTVVEMTPNEVIDMAVYVNEVKNKIIQTSWKHKDTIDKKKQINTIREYDIKSDWT